MVFIGIPSISCTLSAFTWRSIVEQLLEYSNTCKTVDAVLLIEAIIDNISQLTSHSIDHLSLIVSPEIYGMILLKYSFYQTLFNDVIERKWPFYNNVPFIRCCYYHKSSSRQ